MTACARTPTATAPLLYWLILACGLAAFSLRRLAHFSDELLPLWAGTVIGTAIGQGLASLRFPFWVTLLPGGSGQASSESLSAFGGARCGWRRSRRRTSAGTPS